MSERNETILILTVSVHNNVLYTLMCVFVTILENTEAFKQVTRTLSLRIVPDYQNKGPVQHELNQ